MASICEAEMFCVPLLHLLPIRVEEDTTDAEDSALLAHGCFPFLDCTGVIQPREVAVETPDFFEPALDRSH
jgi:hypothetical protein